MMLFVVTLISLLVHVYSTDYVGGDRRYTHYFAFLSLFTASMLGLIMSESTLQLLTCWELVGLCSFALIGHWWEEKPNSDAALKAFITNRVGDVGLICGVIILFFGAGQTFDILEINEMAVSGEISHLVLLVASCSLHRGGHVEVGPVHPPHLAARRHGRPHARCPPSSTPPPWSWPASSWSPASTACSSRACRSAPRASTCWPSSAASPCIGGAGLAFVQNDIKKVLAYSTVSPARLHGDGARRRGLDGGHVPPLHPRHVQGRPVPRVRARWPTPCTPST